MKSSVSLLPLLFCLRLCFFFMLVVSNEGYKPEWFNHTAKDMVGNGLYLCYTTITHAYVWNAKHYQQTDKCVEDLYMDAEAIYMQMLKDPNGKTFNIVLNTTCKCIFR